LIILLALIYINANIAIIDAIIDVIIANIGVNNGINIDIASNIPIISICLFF